MPTENYSHMVMEIKHMVDGDGVGDDGGEETLEIPLSGVERQDQTSSKNEDRGGGGALFREKLRAPGNIGFWGI